MTKKFEPEDEGDQANEEGKYRPVDDASLVHPNIIAVYQSGGMKISERTYRRTMELRVLEARSIDVSAVRSWQKQL